MPSTVIRSFSYDARTHELLVEFRSRRRYVYRQVPQQTFAAMKKAISQGTFFNRHVRDRFAFTHADNDDEALT